MTASTSYPCAAPAAANALPYPLAASSNATALEAENSCVDSQSLLRGQKTVAILHNGTVYRLQATKLGKLILTK